MNIVVCDTGPILHLQEAKILYLLQKVGDIFIPAAVDNELFELDTSWKNQKPSWIIVETLPANQISQSLSLCASGFLHRGEAEAIILVKHLKANWLLTDDTSARIFADLAGLEVHGSLGVILWCASTGHVGYEQAKEYVGKLAQSSLWISQSC